MDIRATCWVIFVWLNFAASASDVTTCYQAVEGTSLSITCNATETQGVHIRWSRDGSSRVLHTGRILEFVGISRNETGNYTCHSINGTDPSQSRYVETVGVNVIYPAKITKFGVQPSVATENQTFTITCMIEGNPSPTWEIRHNRTHEVVYRSHDQGGAVQTVRANCGDDGAYVCTGYNDFNHNVNVTEGQAVDVNCYPRVSPYRPEPLVKHAFLGTAQLFIIEVVGFPAPAYTWSRASGEPMGNVTESGYPTLAVLEFNGIQISDFGNYTLVMNNTFGSSSVDIALLPHPLEPPQPPTNLTFSNVTSDSVILKWISGYDMGGNMSFIVHQWTQAGWTGIREVYEPYTDHGAGQILSYDLTGLDDNTTFILTLTATKMALVSSNSSNIITFTTKVGDHLPTVALSGLSVGLIVGIGIGSAVVACVLVAAVVLLLRRNMIGDHPTFVASAGLSVGLIVGIGIGSAVVACVLVAAVVLLLRRSMHIRV